MQPKNALSVDHWSYSKLRKSGCMVRLHNSITQPKVPHGGDAEAGKQAHANLELYINTRGKQGQVGPKTRNFLNSIMGGAYEVHAEMRLEATVQGIPLLGIADLVAFKKQGGVNLCQLVDFKRNPGLENMKQLQTYAAIIKELRPEIEMFSGQFYFTELEYFTPPVCNYSREFISGIMDDYRTAMLAYEGGHFEPNPSQANCEWCDHPELCPLAKEIEIPQLGNVDNAIELAERLQAWEAVAGKAKRLLKTFLQESGAPFLPLKKGKVQLSTPSPSMKILKTGATEAELTTFRAFVDSQRAEIAEPVQQEQPDQGGDPEPCPFGDDEPIQAPPMKKENICIHCRWTSVKGCVNPEANLGGTFAAECEHYEHFNQKKISECRDCEYYTDHCTHDAAISTHKDKAGNLKAGCFWFKRKAQATPAGDAFPDQETSTDPLEQEIERTGKFFKYCGAEIMSDGGCAHLFGSECYATKGCCRQCDESSCNGRCIYSTQERAVAGKGVIPTGPEHINLDETLTEKQKEQAKKDLDKLEKEKDLGQDAYKNAQETGYYHKRKKHPVVCVKEPAGWICRYKTDDGFKTIRNISDFAPTPENALWLFEGKYKDSDTIGGENINKASEKPQEPDNKNNGLTPEQSALINAATEAIKGKEPACSKCGKKDWMRTFKLSKEPGVVAIELTCKGCSTVMGTRFPPLDVEQACTHCLRTPCICSDSAKADYVKMLKEKYFRLYPDATEADYLSFKENTADRAECYGYILSSMRVHVAMNKIINTLYKELAGI